MSEARGRTPVQQTRSSAQQNRPARMSVSGDIPGSQVEAEGKVVYINPSSLASGGIAEKAAAIFRVYDTQNKNSLEHEFMMSALAELGVLNGLTSKKLSEILSIGAELSQVGKERTYTLQEFVSFYERLAHYQAKAARQDRIKAQSKTPGIPDGAESNELLKRVFNNYAKYTVGQSRSTYDENDPKMSSTQFVKLCQDLGLVQPNGPLNVVTVDVTFHKCKPVGGRRLLFANYLKALSSAAEETNMNVFELIGVLGQQITPSKSFVAPQPVIFRQETRSTEQSKVILASTKVEAEIVDPHASDDDRPAIRQPRLSKPLPLSDDEEVSKPKLKAETKTKAVPPAPQPKATKISAEESFTIKNETTGLLYSTGQAGKDWLGMLPPDAPEYLKEICRSMNQFEKQVRQYGKSQLVAGTGVDYAAFEAIARKAGVDPEVVIAAIKASGMVGSADMAGLLADVHNRLKSVEGGTGDPSDPGGGDKAGLINKVDGLEKALEEVRTGDKLRGEMKEEMKKLAKTAATAATKGLSGLEQRVTVCEGKEVAQEQAQAQTQAQVAALESKVKSLAGGAAITGGRQTEANTKSGAHDGQLPEWVRTATMLETAVRELQAQVKELQGKNSSLEGQVEKLKSGAGKGNVADTITRSAAPGADDTRASGIDARRGISDAVAMADIVGKIQGMEANLRETQNGLLSALSACGLSPSDAMKDGSTGVAVAKRAAQKSSMSDLTSRLTQLEAKQQETNVTLRKAEALLSGPGAGLAALNAASTAAAAGASGARKDKLKGDDLVTELNTRVDALEAQERVTQASLLAATTACAAVPVLEQTINQRMPDLEVAMRKQELDLKTLALKLPDIETFVAAARTKLSEVDSNERTADARVAELERKAANMDRNSRDLADMIKAVQTEQQGMATNAALSAQLRNTQNGAGATDSATLQLVMATEERLQKKLQQLTGAVNEQSAELDGTKTKYDSTLNMVQVTLEQMVQRMNAQDGSGHGDARQGAYAKSGDLHDLENVIMDRLRMGTDQASKIQHTINQLVADVEHVVQSHNSSEQARVQNSNQPRMSPGVDAGSVHLLEQRIEAKIALQGTQFVTVDALRDWELRFVTADALRAATDKARSNDELILQALKEMDKRTHDKIDVREQVMLRMARQVDVLQNSLRDMPTTDQSVSQFKIIQGRGSAGVNYSSSIPSPLSRPDLEPGQDPLSILLAQAGNIR